MNSTVSGKTLGHLNPIVIGMNIFDLRVNSSAIGNDCVNQLDFGSGIRSHCIWGGGVTFGGQVRVGPIGCLEPLTIRKKYEKRPT